MDLTPDEIRLIEEHRLMRPPGPTWKPRAASSYSTVEKCDAFDRLHSMALDNYNQVKAENFYPENDKEYIFEAVMELLGKDVWETYNKLLK